MSIKSNAHFKCERDASPSPVDCYVHCNSAKASKSTTPTWLTISRRLRTFVIIPYKPRLFSHLIPTLSAGELRRLCRVLTWVIKYATLLKVKSIDTDKYEVPNESRGLPCIKKWLTSVTQNQSHPPHCHRMTPAQDTASSNYETLVVTEATNISLTCKSKRHYRTQRSSL